MIDIFTSLSTNFILHQSGELVVAPNAAPKTHFTFNKMSLWNKVLNLSSYEKKLDDMR